MPYFPRIEEMDWVGFEPTTSAMPMPYPTGLDDRPPTAIFQQFYLDINTFNMEKQCYNYPIVCKVLV